MYISSIGVVGAGKMGAGIAQLISFVDLPVYLYDISPEQVAKGMDEIRSIYQTRVDKGRMSERDASQKLSLVTPVNDIKDLANVDLIIEAVTERAEVKKKVFADLNEVVQPDAIFATNTSAISITELGAASKRPEKFVGMHFFYPANVMKLVEIIPGLQTTEETVRDIRAFTEELRKMPVTVKECPGFLVNRLLLPYLNTCANGAAMMGNLELIEDEARKFGFPMGPFTLMDNLGLDVCMHAGFVMQNGFGPRMAVSPIIQSLVADKRMGIRTGAGFFSYDGQKSFSEYVTKLRPATAEFAAEVFKNAITVMIHEAILCIQEGITDSASLDLAMIAGIGFPLKTEGILHYADSVGLDNVLADIQNVAKSDPEHYHELSLVWPSYLLVQMVNSGQLGKNSGQGFFPYL